MKNNNDEHQFRQVGKGFIINPMEGIAGRILTQAFEDRKKRPYVRVNGEIIPLTEQHSFLAVN